MTDQADRQKQAVAVAAAALVENGMVVGLGTGSTAAYMIEVLGQRWAEGLRFVGIPTSERSAEQARALGIELVTFATHPVIDLAIDGADEVERGTLDLIKGLGGALFREKIVAAAAKRFVVVADASKLVDHLGTRTAVPVEVTPFGWERTAYQIEALGATTVPRRDRTGSFFVTDGGNYILDSNFGVMDDPPRVARELREVVGVVESGFFIGRTSEVLIAGADGVTRMVRS
ncbi:ribose-5-phosphate isomerase RpiA [Ameyamaea chiangmaiensis]|nr:ribose-5-phosphate isomerase RpiA [Ameyamaea chiangmaiensis]